MMLYVALDRTSKHYELVGRVRRLARILAGICLVSAGALLSISCRPAWWTYAGWALLALLIPAVVLIGWCAGVLLAPARAGATAPSAR